MRRVRYVVEQHEDGFVANPLGLKGVVVGQGNTYDEALADVRSAVRFHVEAFGTQVLDDNEVLQAYLVEEPTPV